MKNTIRTYLELMPPLRPSTPIYAAANCDCSYRACTQYVSQYTYDHQYDYDYNAALNVMMIIIIIRVFGAQIYDAYEYCPSIGSNHHPTCASPPSTPTWFAVGSADSATQLYTYTRNSHQPLLVWTINYIGWDHFWMRMHSVCFRNDQQRRRSRHKHAGNEL